MQQLHGTGEIVRDKQKPQDRLRKIEQLHGTERHSGRQPIRLGECDRHSATQWDQ